MKLWQTISAMSILSVSLLSACQDVSSSYSIERKTVNGLPVTIPPNERGRKDVIRLGENDDVEIYFRFRDFVGRYPFHCHNVVHEDHAMMLIWEIVEGDGDNIKNP